MIDSFNDDLPKPNPKIFVIIGDTGVGKSFAVRKKYGDDLYTTSVIQNKKSKCLYFNGYYYHKAVLFDDFDNTTISISSLLRIIDEYPVLVQRQRTTAISFVPQVIIFTSNTNPNEWYKTSSKKTIDALLRRIDTIYNMDISDRSNVLDKMPNLIKQNMF